MSSKITFFVYYQPTSNLDFLRSGCKTGGAAPKKVDLNAAVSRFKAQHNTGSNLDVKALPDIGGFSVHAATEAPLNKLPETFEDFTRGDVSSTKPPRPCKL